MTRRAIAAPAVQNASTSQPDAILAALQRLEAKLDLLLSRPRMSDDDDEILLRLIPGIAGTWGSQTFATRELFEHPVLSELTAGRSPKALGRLLHRNTGRNIDGFVIERQGDESGAALWRIVGFPGNQATNQATLTIASSEVG